MNFGEVPRGGRWRSDHARRVRPVTTTARGLVDSWRLSASVDLIPSFLCCKHTNIHLPTTASFRGDPMNVPLRRPPSHQQRQTTRDAFRAASRRHLRSPSAMTTSTVAHTTNECGAYCAARTYRRSCGACRRRPRTPPEPVYNR